MGHCDGAASASAAGTAAVLTWPFSAAALLLHVHTKESKSTSHSSTPQLKPVCSRVCAGTISLISQLCLFVCRCTP